MVLFALEQAINKCVRGEHEEDDEEEWSNEITKVCIEAATTIIDYLIRQTLIMMDLNEIMHNQVTCALHLFPMLVGLRNFFFCLLRILMVQLSPSSLTRGHISETTLGKYKVEELFGLASDHGFGSMIDQITPTKEREKKFHKSPYDLLSSDARGLSCKRFESLRKNADHHLRVLTQVMFLLRTMRTYLQFHETESKHYFP